MQMATLFSVHRKGDFGLLVRSKGWRVAVTGRCKSRRSDSLGYEPELTLFHQAMKESSGGGSVPLRRFQARSCLHPLFCCPRFFPGLKSDTKIACRTTGLSDVPQNMNFLVPAKSAGIKIIIGARFPL
jgi:hypothetical protein